MIQAVYIGTGIIHELVITSSQHVLPPRRGLVTARSTLHHGRGSVQEHLRTPASEVGGESVTTLPPWPPYLLLECNHNVIFVVPLRILFSCTILAKLRKYNRTSYQNIVDLLYCVNSLLTLYFFEF